MLFLPKTTLEAGKTLTVDEGGSLTTNGHLTLGDNATVYLERDASLNNYGDINGYKPNDEGGNGSQILHEDHSEPKEPGAAESTCTICGSYIPHQWGKDWSKNDTHHWHECVANDCSVFASTGGCTITENKDKKGYGDHVFTGKPLIHSGTGIMYQLCDECEYERTFAVELNKLDNKNRALEGAVFGLFSDQDCQSPVTEGGKNVTAESDENGKVVFTEGISPNSTYYIKETTAPENFEVSDKVFKAVINEEGGTDSVRVIYSARSYGSDEPYTTITSSENFPKDNSFFLCKDDNCSQYLGAIKAYFDIDGNISFKDLNNNSQPYDIKNLKGETAYFRYYGKNMVIRIEINAAVNVAYSSGVHDDSGNVAFAGVNGIPVCVNKRSAAEPDPIQIIKRDGKGAALAGAVFGLYSDSGCTDKVGSGTSAADGKVSFTADAGKEIEVSKTYYIKEITAPDGYTASNKAFRAAVGADGKVTYGADNSEDIPVCVNEKSAVSEVTTTPADETTATTPSETTATTPSETTATTPSETTVTTPEVTTAPAPFVTENTEVPYIPGVTRPIVSVWETEPDNYPRISEDQEEEDVAAAAALHDSVIYGEGYSIAMLVIVLVIGAAALTFLLWRCTKI